MSDYRIETKCLQEGYKPKNSEPRVMPIFQSTTYKYDSSEHLGKLFDLEADGHMYTRISNPTTSFVEEKINSLEGGVGCLLTSSGQAASFLAIYNIASAGDNFVSLASIYGGTINLFAVTMKRMGIEVRFVTPGMTDEEIDSLFDERTRLVFGETLANPALHVLDIEKYAKIAHDHGVPLIVDNTFLSPYFQNPLELGADIVIHSGTKYLGGHNDTLAGFLVTNRQDISDKFRFLIKTVGSGLAPFDSWLILRGIKTLPLRMEKSQQNAQAIVEFLLAEPKVKKVYYPGIEGSQGYEICKKQARGFGAMLTFELESAQLAKHILKYTKLIPFAESLGGVETLLTYPCTQTHADVPEEVRIANGITDKVLRMSVGIEDAEDLIADLKYAIDSYDGYLGQHI